MKALPARLGLLFLLASSLIQPFVHAADQASSIDSVTIQPAVVRGLHLSAPSNNQWDSLLAFVRETLPKAGVNTLILEFNYNFNFQSRPEFADSSAMGKDQVRALARACRENGIELIPQINCLGHQSWAKRNDRLLEKHPEFDETPGKFPGNEGIYCRSYCPRHPELHAVLFDLMDELIDACEAKAFHVGMDEVFILADPDCPRCQGKDPARLFADEVNALHDHLAEKGCRLWMWGDRFLDGKAMGLGKWEASENGTQTALDWVPKDLVICDWHYERAPDTIRYFAERGFDVVACPWRKPQVALAQWEQVKALRSDTNHPNVARHALGMVQTTWCGFPRFVSAYNATDANAQNKSAKEAVDCFRALCAAMK